MAQFLDTDEILMRSTRYQALGVWLTSPTGVVLTAVVMAAFWPAVGAFVADAGTAAAAAAVAGAGRGGGPPGGGGGAGGPARRPPEAPPTPPPPPEGGEKKNRAPGEPRAGRR